MMFASYILIQAASLYALLGQKSNRLVVKQKEEETRCWHKLRQNRLAAGTSDGCSGGLLAC